MGSFESGHLAFISPPEDKPVGFDWKESELYPGDAVFTVTEANGNVVLVLEDDLKNYFESQFGEAEELG